MGVEKLGFLEEVNNVSRIIKVEMSNMMYDRRVWGVKLIRVWGKGE